VGSDEVTGMQKAMAKMDELAAFDFVRLMEKYNACERAPLEEMFRKGFVRLRASDYYGKILKLVARMPVKM